MGNARVSHGSEEGHTTPSILDAQTEQFLSERAVSVGLVTQSWESRPITMTLKAHGIEPEAVTTRELEDVAVPIYDYPPAIYQFSTADTDRDDGEKEYYAADWPRRGENGTFTFEAYIFNRVPAADAVETAKLIQILADGFRFGDLQQTFHCRYCPNARYWLSISPPDADQDSLSLRDRLAMVADRNCGCRQHETSISIMKPHR